MTTKEPPCSPANNFGGAIPVFCVDNLEAAVHYYVAILGFKLNWDYQGSFASVSRGRCIIFLCQGDQGHPGTWVWIGVDDAGALEAEYRAAGARIRHPCTNYPWAFEMQVEDLDGNVLRFGSDSIADRPFGEWLDMHGRVWPPGS
jgi:catechol 2,3-dioxygenase-like lactoylglutathione lyase family enzyme